MPDRIYSVSYNGRIYDVRAPENVDPTQLFSFVQQQAGGGAQEQKQDENLLEKIPLVGGALAGAADIPLSFGQGLAGVGKTFTDVFGAGNAASDFLANVSDYVDELKSSGSREDAVKAAQIQKAAEGKGTWEEVKAALYSFGLAPLETTASVAGSALPFIAAGLAAAPTGGTSLLPVAAMAGLGTASGVGMLKGDIYDAVKTEAMKAGAPEEQAAAAAEQAQEYGGKNTDMIALGGALGAAASATGFTRQIAGTIGKRAAARVAAAQAERRAVEAAVRETGGELAEFGARKGVVRGTLTGAAEEAIPEAAQAGQERFAQNLALQREGYDVDLSAGVAGQAAFEGIASLIPGGYGGARETKFTNLQARQEAAAGAEAQVVAGRDQLAAVLNDETATPEERDVAVSAYKRSLENVFGDPAFAEEMAAAEQADIVAQAEVRKQRAATAAQEGETPTVTPEIAGAPTPATEETPSALRRRGVLPEDVIAKAQTKVKADLDLARASETSPLIREPSDAEIAVATELYARDTRYAPIDLINAAISDADTKAARAQQQEQVTAKPLDIEEPVSTATPVEEASPAAGIDIPEVMTPELEAFLAAEDQYEQVAPAALAEEAPVAEAPAPPAPLPTPQLEIAAPNLEFPQELQDAQAFVNEYNPGFKINYHPEMAKPYSYSVAGQKQKIAGSATTNLETLKKRIINERPVQPKQVIGGVPVKQIPAGKARGLEERPPMSRDEIGGTEDPAGALNVAQREQVKLLNQEIDDARNQRMINDGERTQLVDMLRTPDERGLMRDTTWRLASTYQKQIDVLTKEGLALRSEEIKLAEKTGRTIKEAVEQKKPLTAEERNLQKRIKDNATATKTRGRELLKQKQQIYDNVRERLKSIQDERAKRIESAQRNYKAGRINEVEYKRILREARPEPAIRYRKGRAQPAGILLSDLTDAVGKITGKWRAPLDVKMVQSISELPASIRTELEENRRADSFGFLKGKTVYLIADNMHSVDDVAPTLFHETLGHLGLRKAFREGLDNILTDIYNTNKNVAAATDKWMRQNPDMYVTDENPLARAVEEVLAEASETGPMAVSKFDRLVSYLRGVARKIFGVERIKFSDREVRSMLAMAHELAIDGDSNAVGSTSILYASPQDADEQAEADLDVLNAERNTADAMAKMRASADRSDPAKFHRDTISGLTESLKGRNVKSWLKGLSLGRVMKQFIGGGGLQFLPTDGMLEYAETRLGADNPSVKAMREAADNVDRMNATRSTMRRSLARIVRDLKDFVNLHGNTVLGDTMYYGNYYNMDLPKFTSGMSLEDAYKTDGVWRRYSKLLKKTDLTPAMRTDYEKKLRNRESEIRQGITAWNELGKLRGGHNLYVRIRNMHRDMYQARRHLIKKYLANLKDAGVDEEVVNKMMRAYQEQYERMNNMEVAPDKEDAHAAYPEVPVGVFHREYFPKRRFGNYWLRQKQTKLGEPILSFYSTMAERDAALASFADDMGFDPESSDANEYYDLGNDAKRDLNGEFEGANTSTAFNRALNIVGNIDPKNFTPDMQKKLQADVYQLFLMASPEGSVGKQFIKSKNRLGWSQDILQIVGASAEEYASDIARLRFGQKIDQSIREAHSAYKSEPRPQQLLAKDFINNLEQRIQGDMEPQPEGLANKIVPWMNQFAFVSFLTAPATALVQITALPIRVTPHLWGKYGLAGATKAMARYTNVFNNVPRLEAENEQSKSYRILSLREASQVKNNKLRSDALRRATDEFGIIKPLSEFVMGNERTPETAAAGKIADTRQKAYDAMTYLFDTTEQLTREVAFMATYDLEYEKLTKGGMSSDESHEKAILAGRDVVNDTLGNYTNFNRPTVMKGSELARALFLFKQYSVVTTKFFFTSMRAIFGKNTPTDVRVAAMKEATGVLGMSFLFGGVTGLPLYSLGMLALEALQSATDDDDDRKERMRQNPITADSVEAQFRYEWLPQKFGSPMFADAEGKGYPLSDIILNGPISELSGWNFGSRVSLDFLGLWFRSPKDADTWVGTVNNALVENIPGVSASLNMAAMGEEFSKGNINDALKVGLPAAFRGMAKAYDFANEGLRTKSEKIRLREEDITNGMLVGTALGFNPTQIAKLQQQTRDVLGRTRELQEGKSDLVGAYTRAVRRIRNGDADGYSEAREAVQDIEEYNQKVGNPYFGISYTNLVNALRGSLAEEAHDIHGMGLTEIEAFYADKTLRNQ